MASTVPKLQSLAERAADIQQRRARLDPVVIATATGIRWGWRDSKFTNGVYWTVHPVDNDDPDTTVADGWDVRDLSPLRDGVPFDDLPVLRVRTDRTLQRVSMCADGHQNLVTGIEYVLDPPQYTPGAMVNVKCRVYLYALVPDGAVQGDAEVVAVPHPDAARPYLEIEAPKACDMSQVSEEYYEVLMRALHGTVEIGGGGSVVVIPDAMNLVWPVQVWDWRKGEMTLDMTQPPGRVLPLGHGHEDIVALNPESVLVCGKVADDGCSAHLERPDPADVLEAMAKAAAAAEARQHTNTSNGANGAGEDSTTNGDAHDSNDDGEEVEDDDAHDSNDDWEEVEDDSDDSMDDSDGSVFEDDGNDFQVLGLYEKAPRRQTDWGTFWDLSSDETNQTGGLVVNYRKGTSPWYPPFFRILTDTLNKLVGLSVSEARTGNHSHAAVFPLDRLLPAIRDRDPVELDGTRGALDWVAFGDADLSLGVYGDRALMLVRQRNDDDGNSPHAPVTLYAADYAPGATSPDGLPTARQPLQSGGSGPLITSPSPPGFSPRISKAWDWSRGAQPNPEPDGPDAPQPKFHPVIAQHADKYRLSRPGVAVALDIGLGVDDYLLSVSADDERIYIAVGSNGTDPHCVILCF